MKRFEKKLDEYYVNKYIDCLQDFIFINWNFDFKVKKRNNIVEVFIKNRKYIDKHYETLISFRKDKAFYFICNFDKHQEFIIECIKEYDKENK